MRPIDTPAGNVLAGWLGMPVPSVGKQRRRPYRKTGRRRPDTSRVTQVASVLAKRDLGFDSRARRSQLDLDREAA